MKIPEEETIGNLIESCTIDEAVMYLMGWKLGSLRLKRVSGGAEDDGMDYYEISLHEILSNDLEMADAEYSNAKVEPLSSEVIAEKLVALEKARQRISQAKNFLYDLVEELSKEGTSDLRKDILATKHSNHPFITLRSLKLWAHAKYKITLFPDQNSFPEKKNPGEISKHRQQENAIKDEISRLGYNLKSLPENESGKSGVKNEVRVALQDNPLFGGTTVFDKAWERLLNFGDIAYVN